MTSEQPNKQDQPPKPRQRTLPQAESMRLDMSDLSTLTLGDVERMLKECPIETKGRLHLLLTSLSQLASSETAQVFSLIAASYRANADRKECNRDWGLFFDKLKRERATVVITDRTTLGDLSELLWEMHTAQ
jgi:hypothetical protein